MQLVNKEDCQSETKVENEFPLSCLIDIQCLFSFQPFTHFRTTTRQQCGRQEEKESRDLVSSRNGTGPQNVSQAPPPFPLPIAISALEAHHRHTLLLHPWLLPWQLFVFQHSLAEEESLTQSSNSPFSRTNIRTHTHTLFKQCYRKNIAVLSHF